MKRQFILFIFLLGISFGVFSQKEVRKQIRLGNKEYKAEQFTDAEISYRKALEANAQSSDAAYNLGNALYKQNKLQEAAEQYQVVINAEKDKEKLSHAWHNMGNIFMGAQDYAKSIEAYKQALRNNPADHETRYNLALAQKLLEDQEQEKDQQGDNQDQEKDQNKDEQQDQNEDQNKEQQDDPNKQDKTQDQPQQNEKMSKDNAQQILDAMLQDEKDTQEKVMEAQKKQQQQRKVDKNW